MRQVGENGHEAKRRVGALPVWLQAELAEQDGAAGRHHGRRAHGMRVACQISKAAVRASWEAVPKVAPHTGIDVMAHPPLASLGQDESGQPMAALGEVVIDY